MLAHQSDTPTSGYPIVERATETVTVWGNDRHKKVGVCSSQETHDWSTKGYSATAGAIHLHLEVTKDPSKLMRSLTGVRPAFRMPYMAQKLFVARPMALPSVWTGVTVKPRSTKKRRKSPASLAVQDQIPTWGFQGQEST